MSERHISIAAAVLSLALASPEVLAEAEEPIVLPAGEFQVTATAGAVSLDKRWTWGVEASVRAGLPLRLEIALPLALAVDLYSDDRGSGLSLAGGAVDMWIANDGRFLWTPAAVLSARLRVASSAALLTALDFTGVEDGFGADDHPWWLRGSVALLIDMGPYLTVGGGFAYQRHMFGGDTPRGARRLGWVGDARVSFGAVRAQAFQDLPTISIHATDWLHIVALIRVDVDNDTRTVDARYLLGLRLDISLLGEE